MCVCVCFVCVLCVCVGWGGLVGVGVCVGVLFLSVGGVSRFECLRVGVVGGVVWVRFR